MLTVDDTRPPTAFQRHVLRVLRCCGPCSLSALSRQCDRPGQAVRLAAWILVQGGYAHRSQRRRAS